MIALRNRFRENLDVPVWFVMIALLLIWLGTAGANNGQSNHRYEKLGRAVPVRGPLKLSPSRPTLDVGLNRILEDRSPVERAQELGYKTKGDRIQLVLVTKDGKNVEVLAWLKDNGATNLMLAGNLVEAFIPIGLLETIAVETRILYVRKPLYVIPEPEAQPRPHSKVGAYTSEGVPAMNADAWHTAGYTGQSVTVAVVDEGFMGATALIGTELPQGRTFGDDFSGLGLEDGSAHGTACAEIVYDVAPGIAELHLYRATTPVEVVNAINTATVRNIDVISMSLGWLVAGPGDGTGEIANAVNLFVAAGGTIAISAGNSRLSHWQGSWYDPEGNGYLNFFSESEVNFLTTDGDSPYEVPAGELVSVQLNWNQWSTPTTDLDLQLHRWNPELEQWDLVDSSELPQNGTPGQIPIEVIAFTTIEAGYYGFTVTHFSGPTSVDIEVIARPDMPLSVFVQDGSVLVPGDTGSAMSVAALNSAPPYSLEVYSSRGPTNGAGGSLTGGYVKPDISGYANVSTASYGYGVFNGTSAACPHVAGAAALVWGANTNWTNSQVRSYLESHAEDKGTGGKDIDYGYGRLYLGSPGTSPPPGGGGPCNQDLDGGVVCLRDGRFEFIGTWTDFANPPNTQPLIWTPVENINATAGFQNNPSGIQIVMRVADGCSQTGTYWVWLGGFTGAGWDITVRDTVTGKSRDFNKPRHGSLLPTTTRDSTTFTCN